MSDQTKVCFYCEKPGQLVHVRGMEGDYHLRCLKDAREAWAAGRGPSPLDFLRRR